MALIKCTECGKEFSDRAAACPNCGCPTDIILEDIEKEKSIQQKKIVASYDIGDYKFEIDSKMDYRIRLISDFCQKRDQIKILAGKMYDEFGNIDKANGFYFWNLYNIKQHEDFKYFNNAVNLPNDCEIYLLCEKMQYNPKIPKYVIAITEHGMYVYQKRTDEIEGIQLFYSWHNLENLKIEVCPEGGIYIDGKLFKSTDVCSHPRYERYSKDCPRSVHADVPSSLLQMSHPESSYLLWHLYRAVEITPFR